MRFCAFNLGNTSKSGEALKPLKPSGFLKDTLDICFLLAAGKQDTLDEHKITLLDCTLQTCLYLLNALLPIYTSNQNESCVTERTGTFKWGTTQLHYKTQII